MPLKYDILLGQLVALLRAGHTITVRWDCGSDEHIVTTQLDGVEQEFDFGDNHNWLFATQEEQEARLARVTSLPILLGDFVIGLLGLPSVGEFHMQGDGRIFLENGSIWLEYQSDATSYDDGWEPDRLLPEYYLSPSELAELFPERLAEMAAWHGMARQPANHPDPQLAAAYTGRMMLFQL